MLSREDKIKILRWRLDNWQDKEKDVFHNAPPEVEASEGELKGFMANIVVRHGTPGMTGDIFKIHDAELERLRKESYFDNTSTVTPSGGAVMFEFENRDHLTLTALPEKDGEDRNKIALFAGTGPKVEMKADIKCSEAIKKIILMGGTQEQVGEASDFFKTVLSKSKTEKETTANVKAGTTGFEAGLGYRKKRKMS